MPTWWRIPHFGNGTALGRPDRSALEGQQGAVCPAPSSAVIPVYTALAISDYMLYDI